MSTCVKFDALVAPRTSPRPLPPQYLEDPLLVPLEDDDYIAFGLACCFVMNDNLKLDGEIWASFCLTAVPRTLPFAGFRKSGAFHVMPTAGTHDLRLTAC